MRLLFILLLCLALSIVGFSLALAQQPDEVSAITELQRVDNARWVFVDTYNDWAKQHGEFTTSSADKERFRKVRKAWKEFDRLSRNVEY